MKASMTYHMKHALCGSLFILGEYYDGGFTESLLQLQKTDLGLLLVEEVYHYNANRAQKNTYLVAKPASFHEMVVQICRHWQAYGVIETEVLECNADLMDFFQCAFC